MIPYNILEAGNFSVYYPQILSDINSNQIERVESAVVSIRKILSVENNPPIDWVIESGLVQKLHYLLQNGTPNIQFESSWSLTNVASGSSAHTKYVVDNGVVHTFIMLLNSPDEQLSEQCLWALGNITGDSSALRDYVLSLGLTDALVNIVERDHKLSFIRNLSWTISNMCRGSPPPNFKFIKPLFPSLAKFLRNRSNPKEDHVIDAVWALAFITDSTTSFEAEIFQEIVKLNILPDIFYLLGLNYTELMVPSFRVVGNLLSGSDSITQVLLDMGVLNYIARIIQTQTKVAILKDAYWALSNITSGTFAQIQMVFRTGMMPDILKTGYSANDAVKTEILWVITNAISGSTSEQIEYLYKIGTADYLAEMVGFAMSKSNLQHTYLDNVNIFIRKTNEAHLSVIAKKFLQAGWSTAFNGLQLQVGDLDIIENITEIFQSVNGGAGDMDVASRFTDLNLGS